MRSNKGKKAPEFARSMTPIWAGSAYSLFLLAIFLWLQAENSSVLGLPVQYLVASAIPVLIGLLLSGYVREIKAGGYEFSLNQDLLDEAQEIPDAGIDPAKSSMVPQSWPSNAWQMDRDKEYARTRGYMLAHVYRPSLESGQKYDISVFVVRHEKGTSTPPRRNLAEIRRAEFFFGASWGNKVFPVDGNEGFFAVRMHAWGTFLAICRLTFHDDNFEPVTLYRYIDFSMAEDAD
jgi:hypothetical protein